jgi:hypothetical protein
MDRTMLKIDTINITIGREQSALARAFIDSLFKDQPSAPTEPPPPVTANPVAQAQHPRIGEAWPTGGIYAGISRGEDGAPDAHLVLLTDKPAGDLNWRDADAWVEGLGGGARLPTRFESALLYANLRDQFDTGPWYWTGTQCSELTAWNQYFDYGGQYYDGKSYEAQARAVRRFPL